MIEIDVQHLVCPTLGRGAGGCSAAYAGWYENESEVGGIEGEWWTKLMKVKSKREEGSKGEGETRLLYLSLL